MIDTEDVNDTIDRDYKLLKGDYSTTFNTPEGLRVLEDLKHAYYHRISFSRDPYATAYNEGQRAVIIRIINLISKEENNG
jgi:hypothetical protein